MLHRVPPQQFKAFVILVEQNNIVFFSELEGLDGLGNHGLDLLIGWLEPLVLLHRQQLLGQSFKFSSTAMDALKNFRRISKDSHKVSIKYFLNFQTLYNTIYFVYTYIYKYNRVHINTITLMYAKNYWVDVVHSPLLLFSFLFFSLFIGVHFRLGNKKDLIQMFYLYFWTVKD